MTGPVIRAYRRRVPRSDRRVMLALLSGAANLSGYPLDRAPRGSGGVSTGSPPTAARGR